jgi:hypothetical protein
VLPRRRVLRERHLLPKITQCAIWHACSTWKHVPCRRAPRVFPHLHVDLPPTPRHTSSLLEQRKCRVYLHVLAGDNTVPCTRRWRITPTMPPRPGCNRRSWRPNRVNVHMPAARTRHPTLVDKNVSHADKRGGRHWVVSGRTRRNGYDEPAKRSNIWRSCKALRRSLHHGVSKRRCPAQARGARHMPLLGHKCSKK